MSPLSPPPSWFNDEDPHSPIMKQSSSLLAPLTNSPPRSESNHLERLSPSPLLAGQTLAPSALLLPNLPAPALQKNVRSHLCKRSSEKLETEVEHGRKVARHEAQSHTYHYPRYSSQKKKKIDNGTMVSRHPKDPR
ncbi:hypothetical protein B0H65DRAFT_45894 [Neurospora tetraspora]|uniref:Uncharacterized protein n=1 Tax=Neurospora tetraspora TaxID=94610 RepID=A0AAE0JQ18_9PEZI|nr:hypothetical protein B0H65DRAFT_45894 [Neurospora tetraspora]